MSIGIIWFFSTIFVSRILTRRLNNHFEIWNSVFRYVCSVVRFVYLEINFNCFKNSICNQCVQSSCVSSKYTRVVKLLSSYIDTVTLTRTPVYFCRLAALYEIVLSYLGFDYDGQM